MDVDVEDRGAQTSYADSLLTTMRQVHSQIEELEVRLSDPFLGLEKIMTSKKTKNHIFGFKSDF